MPALNEIQIRDPFVLHVPEEDRYHLFGSTDADIWRGPATGFDTYWSTDLAQWHGPIPAFRPASDFWSHTQYWAPEVHRYDGAYYMFATFTAEGRRRGTQVLRADRAAGPYTPWSEGPLTPRDWECLDGTLHVEDGTPYMVFCHEWKDVGDGEIRALELTPDLRGSVDGSQLLFTASEAPWARPLDRPGSTAYVTDGPFLHRTADGRLLMLWSSMGEGGYALGVATSESGGVRGPWRQAPEPLWPQDGGHGMVFRDGSGRLWLTLHQPNRTPEERARFIEVEEAPGGLALR
ncbi:glycoside hydrolase family 43 protein [Glycomyces sp. TRM65418]|uniref:glycoside hydrolase family 43 protein n=1 Tax=Glycomyces sp. TRM65418 TaxID=2867006 RepID=UPI001CE52B4F|nr:glycoside hydrolase family 43 protein [Glycomyces sp. TRM65418]MCC3763302.1 glycoside hydrolase family 43 protein [Glycomyces sp. TRM65418]QZD57301.1 glycoside hydrolase family 43 protein [Glycomyces sp. TRM65418]